MTPIKFLDLKAINEQYRDVTERPLGSPDSRLAKAFRRGCPSNIRKTLKHTERPLFFYISSLAGNSGEKAKSGKL